MHVRNNQIPWHTAEPNAFIEPPSRIFAETLNLSKHSVHLTSPFGPNLWMVLPTFFSFPRLAGFQWAYVVNAMRCRYKGCTAVSYSLALLTKFLVFCKPMRLSLLKCHIQIIVFRRFWRQTEHVILVPRLKMLGLSLTVLESPFKYSYLQ
jgi:hypothetical protein